MRILRHSVRLQYATLLFLVFLLGACISLEDATSSPPVSSPLPAIGSPLAEPPSPLEIPSLEEREDAVEYLVQLASADLAAVLGIEGEDIKLVEVEPVQWRDTSLGCPKPGMMYAQVITPGYRLTLEVDGQPHVYHTDGGKLVVRCEEEE